MAQHVNFYENIKEASMRLSNTIVMYDGEPYYILCITDHKGDGIFRVYMDKLGNPGGMAHQKGLSIPYEWMDTPAKTKGQAMDEWLEKYPDKGVIRKMANSPKFNKFRPFPLGMCNNAGSVLYVERTPTRYTQQGLTSSMVNYHELTPSDVGSGGTPPIRRSIIPAFTGFEFYKTIQGIYPDAKECLKNLHDPEVVNTGAGFHRNFAFVRGPVGLMFLAYKQDIVGYMPDGDLTRVTIAPKFKHTKEAVADLQLFEDIRV